MDSPRISFSVELVEVYKKCGLQISKFSRKKLGDVTKFMDINTSLKIVDSKIQIQGSRSL